MTKTSVLPKKKQNWRLLILNGIYPVTKETKMPKRKPIILTVCCCLLVLVTITSCSKEKKTGTGTIDSNSPYAAATVLTGGILRVGMECAYAPFNWTQSTPEVAKDGWVAEPIYGTSDYGFGYDVMFAKKIADELGWKLEIHKVQWSSIILGLKTKEFDTIIGGMIYSEKRDQTLDFTRAYYNRDNVMVIKKGGKYEKAKTLSDFTGCRSTTQINTNWAAYVSQIPDVKVIPYPESTAEVVMQVAMNNVDCAVLDYPTGFSATLSNPEVSIIRFEKGKGFTTPEGASEACSVAVDEGNTVLRDAISLAMDSIDWQQKDMDKYMDLAIQLQPLNK
jgi:putative lysine transport system substrate-binding protein